MIDTIVLESPTLEEEIAFKIESLSIQRSGIDFEVGEVLYQFTTKELKGSFDSSIRINIKREKWVSQFDLRSRKNIAVKQQCEPYLEIECSLHKFFLGHNVYGGSDDIVFQVKELISFIGSQFNIDLPSYDTYTIKRIDIAKVYDLGKDISNFFEGFSNVYYPRRQCQKYGNTGLYFPGTYTTLKLYDKGVEFKKHDKKRLRHFLQPQKLIDLENIAFGKLRIELEVKARKLRHIYNDKLPLVNEIKINDLHSQFNVELKRIFKVSENNMKIYNNSNDVEKVLFEKYGNTGNIYLGTWYRLTINGYDKVKNSMNKSTFYRHINKLKDASVSWNHTDIIQLENKVVEFVFNPLNTNLEVVEDLIAS